MVAYGAGLGVAGLVHIDQRPPGHNRLKPTQKSLALGAFSGRGLLALINYELLDIHDPKSGLTLIEILQGSLGYQEAL
jgi:hypothetical protein